MSWWSALQSGVSLLPDNAREISALVNQSNMAMQHAKHLGGNNFQFYTDSLYSSGVISGAQ